MIKQAQHRAERQSLLSHSLICHHHPPPHTHTYGKKKYKKILLDLVLTIISKKKVPRSKFVTCSSFSFKDRKYLKKQNKIPVKGPTTVKYRVEQNNMQ